MALEYRVKSLSDVEESFKSLYTEDNGSFVLSVKGAVDKSKLDEFRENNIELKKKFEDVNKRYDGIDPDKYRELSDKAQKERDKKLIDSGKVDELVNERVTAMKAEYDKRVNLMTENEKRLTTQLEGLVIDNAIRDAAAKSGVRATAVDDVLLRGRMLFKLKDGKAVPMDGDKPVFGKSGDPMAIDEWVGTLTEKAPHLFESSTGSGAKGGAPAPMAGRVNRSDTKSFLENIDAIASGKMSVV